MANITLTNLPTVVSLNGTEPLLGVQSGSSVQITTGQIAGLAKGISSLPFPVSVGGTGDTTLTQYGLMYGNGTSAVGTVTPPAGTNYVLVGSSGSAPTWQPTIPVTAGVDSISFGTTGLTPSTDTAGVITVAGTLVAANGGTGQSSYTIGDLLYASSSTALSKLADVATGSVLISGGVGVAPSYSSSPTISGTTTSGFFIANGTITGSLSQGAYSYGTLGYSDSNILGSFTTSVNSYDQIIVQNTNAGASASTNILVSNNLGTASTYFGEFGMNSSAFSGTGAFNAANTVYLDATSADLAIGTTTSNAIHFVVNSGTTDAATISSAGVFSLGTALAVGSGGTGQSSNWTQWGAIYASTTGALASTAAGTTGQVLIGNTGAAPSWGAIPSTAAVTSITFGTTGLTPSTATTGAVTVAGTLNVANGGTGQSSALTQYGVVYGSTTTAMATSAAGTTGQVLVGTTGAAPSWTNALTGITTLTATGAITHNTTTNNQSYTTTGAGTITVSSGTLGTIDNITIGGTTRAAGNFTFIGAGKANSTAAFVNTAAGTTAIAPIQLTSGTNLTTAAAGAMEYDGSVFYETGTTTLGRGYVPVTQYFKLTANGSAIGPAISNYFGASSGISFDASGYYEFEAELFFTKTTAGTVTFTMAYSQSPILVTAYYVGTPVGGVGTVGSPQTAATLSSTSNATALPATGSLTTAVNHQYKIYAIFQANATTGGSFNLQITSSAGTVTPLALSNFKVRRISTANTGTFA